MTKKTGNESGGGEVPSSGMSNVRDFLSYRQKAMSDKIEKQKIGEVKFEDDPRMRSFLDGMKYQNKLTELQPLREDPQIGKKLAVGGVVGVIGKEAYDKAKRALESKKEKDLTDQAKK